MRLREATLDEAGEEADGIRWRNLKTKTKRADELVPVSASPRSGGPRGADVFLHVLSAWARGLLAVRAQALLRARGDHPGGCADPQQLHAKVRRVSSAAETGQCRRHTPSTGLRHPSFNTLRALAYDILPSTTAVLI